MVPPLPLLPYNKYPKYNKHFVLCSNKLIISCSFNVYRLLFSVASPFLCDYSINTKKQKWLNIIQFNIIVKEHHSKIGESL